MSHLLCYIPCAYHKHQHLNHKIFLTNGGYCIFAQKCLHKSHKNMFIIGKVQTLSNNFSPERGRYTVLEFSWVRRCTVISSVANTRLLNLPQKHRAPAAGARGPVTNLSAGGRLKVWFHKMLSIHFGTNYYAQNIALVKRH